jgi:hypothetical protein
VNDRAREVLIQAAMNGLRQITGRAFDADDGRCALGALWEALPDKSHFAMQRVYELDMARDTECPECGKRQYAGEVGLIEHLNDDHRFDFLTIARKMP